LFPALACLGWLDGRLGRQQILLTEEQIVNFEYFLIRFDTFFKNGKNSIQNISAIELSYASRMYGLSEQHIRLLESFLKAG
jgi:hypothetical protein